MVATLNNLPGIQNYNFVGMLNGRKPVGYNYRGAVLHQFYEGILNQAFAFGIECRSSFIKNKHRRIL